MIVDCRAVLLDIEGTVAPVSFVFDVMFPFVRKNLRGFLDECWRDEALLGALELIAKDAGHESWLQWVGDRDVDEQKKLVEETVAQWMESDAKLTGLKQLQGLVWKQGFKSGELVAALFDDVVPALRQWKQAGLELYIYSSGSIGAQKLFFGHTSHGNLLEMFSGHFDTTSGGKKELSSYLTIASEIGIPASDILFISDVVAELDAARDAGMMTLLRPENVNMETGGHETVNDFAAIRLQHSGA